MGILSMGSSGEGVKRLQERLKEFSFYQGEITGNFDAATEGAVKSFQDADGLAADGSVGLMTLQALGLLQLKTIE
ncbi:MAG: peptidoglycan-binding protein [Okeania sp. SIO2C2]|uniref:peptidoglycan-binding domain-containing protein n=1 Tax=Okeania sp. SIO2C2 TaxID=2607787 RepID=UPI0013B5C686|nr:peptidoglycan-binding domain-containing protein [Okeania sp. SIO2C2]NEP87328.1 peptidoglycan-binding protein [Okeania sp. SIO2C2]